METIRYVCDSDASQLHQAEGRLGEERMEKLGKNLGCSSVLTSYLQSTWSSYHCSACASSSLLLSVGCCVGHLFPCEAASLRATLPISLQPLPLLPTAGSTTCFIAQLGRGTKKPCDLLPFYPESLPLCQLRQLCGTGGEGSICTYKYPPGLGSRK